jgi:hypothetical protein
MLKKALIIGFGVLFTVAFVFGTASLLEVLFGKDIEARSPVVIESTPMEELPIFEVGVYSVKWRNTELFDLNKDVRLPWTGLVVWEKSTLLIYSYDCEVKFWVTSPPIPELVDGVVVLDSRGMTIEAEARVFNYQYRDCYSKGGALTTIPFEDLFNRLNEGIGEARDKAWTPERTIEAFKNFKDTYSKIYRSLGYEVRWIEGDL